MILRIAQLIQNNLVLLLAAIVLPVKWIVVRLCRDKEAEAVAVLSVPEDLCYVALGLMAGDVVSHTGAFTKYFGDSQYLAMEKFVTMLLALLVAIVLHMIAQWTLGHFRGWRAAQEAYKTRQADLIIPHAESNFETLAMRHFFSFLMGYLLQLLLILPWISWLARVTAGVKRV